MPMNDEDEILVRTKKGLAFRMKVGPVVQYKMKTAPKMSKGTMSVVLSRFMRQLKPGSSRLFIYRGGDDFHRFKGNIAFAARLVFGEGRYACRTEGHHGFRVTYLETGETAS